METKHCAFFEETLDYGVIYFPERTMFVIKKDGSRELFKIAKVICAISKSAYRALTSFTEDEKRAICRFVIAKANAWEGNEIPIPIMHNIVENALEEIKPIVAKSYRDYRNYKQDFVRMLDDVYKKCHSILYVGDKENARTDSALVSTKRSLVYNELNKELYQKFFMTTEEIQACRDGYIYVQDMASRRDTVSGSIFDVENVLSGGFEMGNIHYNEPKTLDVAFDVIGDIVISAASQQYGGLTIPNVELLLEPYAEKSYAKNVEKLEALGVTKKVAEETAFKDCEKEFEQGFQGWEYKFNTVASSRGDYPFISITAGTGRGRFAKLATKKMLEVRANGQGKPGFKKPVLFPKLIFLYDEALHGKGKPLEDIFLAGVECSHKSMSPDWLSLSGEGKIATYYKQSKRISFPIDCRTFLAPWYEKGGIKAFDEMDKPQFIGRFSLGVVSLHLPMILAKARHEGRDFFCCLDYYLELIRALHIRTYFYLGQMYASTNPLAYCEGGFLGGNLKLSDRIKPLLQFASASFGITALKELQCLYNGKSLEEDGKFVIDVLNYINNKIEIFKTEDKNLYTIFATPTEQIRGLQIRQFRKKYGIIEGVSDHETLKNGSFFQGKSCSVIQKKQELYNELWNLSNGGIIQYVQYPDEFKDIEIENMIRKAMKKGFYEGTNMYLAYCDDCGHQERKMDVCPVCGSKNLTVIKRVDGYISYKRIKDTSNTNSRGIVEIAERKTL